MLLKKFNLQLTNTPSSPFKNRETVHKKMQWLSHAYLVFQLLQAGIEKKAEKHCGTSKLTSTMANSVRNKRQHGYWTCCNSRRHRPGTTGPGRVWNTYPLTIHVVHRPRRRRTWSERRAERWTCCMADQTHLTPSQLVIPRKVIYVNRQNILQKQT